MIDLNYFEKIIEALEELPVDCSNFETADKWVGIDMALRQILVQLKALQNTQEEE